MPEVQRFFDSRHPDSYRVYNLCSERQYDAAKFHNRAVRYPLCVCLLLCSTWAEKEEEILKFFLVPELCLKIGSDDHNCPRFELMHQLCQDAKQFLLSFPQYQCSLPDPSEEDSSVYVAPPRPLPPAQLAAAKAGRLTLPDRPMCQSLAVEPTSVTPVAVIHCKAGKGRTGLMICCLMLHLKMFRTAQEALAFYGRQRTSNGKGVTIPSQARYVQYYAEYLRMLQDGVNVPHPLTMCSSNVTDHAMKLTRILMHGVPNFDVGGGCDPYFKIFGTGDELFFDYRKTVGHVKAFKAEKYVDLRCQTTVFGDIKIMCFDQDKIGKDDKMFSCWINTAFVPESASQPGEYIVTLTKSELDGPHQDSSCSNFPESFKIVFHFNVGAKHEANLHVDADPKHVEDEDGAPVASSERAANEPETPPALHAQKSASWGTMLSRGVRSLVSKKKVRYQDDDFDLGASWL